MSCESNNRERAENIMPAKDVDITLQGGIPVASPESINLSHGHGHTCNWDNNLDEAITITFDNGTPFDPKDNPYTIPAHKHCDSGPIKTQPGPNPWKYTIRTASGKVNDPQVIIDN
jgi:hypothetical protein